MRYWTGTARENRPIGKIMTGDDDLRFGDVSGTGNSIGGDGVNDILIKAFQAIVGVYVLLKVVEVLFNVPIPLI
ncbi:hypothetical protein KTS45_01885 [Halomicroarcula limicola]|uniref:Uncharacterized protein n=1 Tax=Haloarcula limicola TaxID=1429915 RepID=A0A8J7Y802_9EURY|nr:hypothetical protein [Halomicroarcula limicola]MBV0922939.1 hypothetical protein [Halomicroarcula limicola]